MSNPSVRDTPGDRGADCADRVDADDPELFHGSPVGLQVMCRRLEEETALGLAGIVTRACQSRES